MKTSTQNIANHRDIIKRKKRLKKEIKLIILKSFLHNKTIPLVNRAFFRFKFLTLWKKNYSFSSHQNVCVLSGKKKSTFKISSMSRQMTKRFIELGFLQSIKIK